MYSRIRNISIACVALIAVGGSFQTLAADEEANKATMLRAEEFWNTGDMAIADEVYSAVSAGFQSLLQKYGGKESGKLARLIYANICYDAGHYKQAIELYNEALKDFETRPMIHSQILNNLGYAYEQQKDYSTAVSYFEKISEAPGQILLDEALFNLGRLYGKLGQPEKSKAAYQKIVSDYPDFIYIDMVKEQISG